MKNTNKIKKTNLAHLFFSLVHIAEGSYNYHCGCYLHSRSYCHLKVQSTHTEGTETCMEIAF